MEASYNEDDNMEGTGAIISGLEKISHKNTYERYPSRVFSTGYHENGKKQVEIVTGMGRHGYKKYWYDHGQWKKKGWFHKGICRHLVLPYDEMGNLQYRTEYLTNDLNEGTH